MQMVKVMISQDESVWVWLLCRCFQDQVVFRN